MLPDKKGDPPVRWDQICSVYFLVQVGLGSLGLYRMQSSSYVNEGNGVAISTALVAVSVAVHLLWRRRAHPSAGLVGLDTVFMPGFLLVHFSLIIMSQFGAFSLDDLRVNDGVYRYVGFAADAKLLSLAVFSSAFMSTAAFDGRRLLVGRSADSLAFKAAASFIGGLVSSLGLVFFAAFLIRGGMSAMFSGEYRGLHGLDPITVILSDVSHMLIVVGGVCGAMVGLRGAQGVRVGSSLALVIAFSYMIALLLHGDRGGLITVGVSMFVAYRPGARLDWKWIVVGAAILIPAIGIVRNARFSKERGLGAIAESANAGLAENASSALINLGQSGIVDLYAIQYVDRFGHFGGRHAVLGVFGAIPFSRGLLVADYLDVKGDEADAGRLMTIYIKGHSRSGVGTTTTASSYLDCGVLGIVYGHAFLGVVAGLVTRRFYVGGASVPAYVTYYVAIGVFCVLARYGIYGPVVRLIGFPLVTTELALFAWKFLGRGSR